MKQILVTGGTVFVSKYVANYFAEKGVKVYVLNRGTKAQLENVTLIKADRSNLGDVLKSYSFDAVIDVCAYKGQDVANLLDALNEFNDYILISSSAVYPETNKQPFTEDELVGENSIWQDYGTGKIEAEQCLMKNVPNAYILRPPYLYGPMQNVYREPFVFDCALDGRKFYIPKDGTMNLQFFHVEDLCKMIELILEEHPSDHIFNVGNTESVDINTFVKLCYDAAGASLDVVNVKNYDNQRDYFPFYEYEYQLDVTRQNYLLPELKDLRVGLKESFDWYRKHPKDVNKRGYIEFINSNLE